MSSIPNYIILTIKKWHLDILPEYLNNIKGNFTVISNRDDLTYDNIRKINPKYIFIPHWSWFIPSEIYENFECIGFHETDLPFGRGGSPIQNLIINNFKETVISAFRVISEYDAGDIYLKKKLSLDGSAEEIFIRSSNIIGEMIQTITSSRQKQRKQSGKITYFKRRKPSQSKITRTIKNLDEFYNMIRMLDAEGYPNAFIKHGRYKITFSKVHKDINKIHCSACIKVDE